MFSLLPFLFNPNAAVLVDLFTKLMPALRMLIQSNDLVLFSAYYLKKQIDLAGKGDVSNAFLDQDARPMRDGLSD